MKRFLALLCALLLLGSVSVFADDDPVITQSYLEQVFLPQLQTEIDTMLSSTLSDAYGTAFRSLTETYAEKNLTAQKQAWANGKTVTARLTLKKGDALTLLPGCKITVTFGTISGNSALIDTTLGAPAGDTLTAKHLYMQSAESKTPLTVRSDTAEVNVDGALKIALASGTDYGSLADALAAMGLFRGRTLGYDLDAGATRAEGLTMFLRLLGLEDEALACRDSVPFADVPQSHWARPYVAYAYTLGLTNGTSATAFSPDQPVTAQHYLTFLMRALHYNEGTAFTWNTVLSDAVTQKIFSQREVQTLTAGSFLRYKMVYLSYYALFCTDQQSRRLLCDELIAQNTLENKTLCAGIAKVRGKRIS
ncbi:MAG: S-layer homology domain-containing protein [Oscillospiraceae bacterium]|nr:S-layer homology domain-containing protein [Oscillospiraceae bacterium]